MMSKEEFLKKLTEFFIANSFTKKEEIKENPVWTKYLGTQTIGQQTVVINGEAVTRSMDVDVNVVVIIGDWGEIKTLEKGQTNKSQRILQIGTANFVGKQCVSKIIEWIAADILEDLLAFEQRLTK